MSAVYGPIPGAVDAAILQVYSVLGDKSYKLICETAFRIRSMLVPSSASHERVYEFIIPFLNSGRGGSHDRVMELPSTVAMKF